MRIYDLTSSLRFEIQDCLCWVVLAEGLPFGCGRDVCWGWSHPKAWLGLQDRLPSELTHCSSIRGLLHRQLECPRDLVADLFQGEQSRRVQSESRNVFNGLASKVKFYHFWNIFSLYKSALCVGRLHMGMSLGGRNHQGAILGCFWLSPHSPKHIL